jgi:SAM-dependent methyltransferase
MYKRVLEKLNLSKNHLLLDAGCGAGLFSGMAIEAGAEVIGVDAAPGLLEIARRRNPNNNFLEEDLETLPFTDNSFHVVAGFNSFQYAGDFEKALTEAKRVLKPGGRLVIAIWDKPEKSDATQVLKAIGTLLPPPPEGTPGPFALSEDGKIESVLERIGMTLTYKTSVSCPFLYASLADGIKSYMGTGPAAAAMNYCERHFVRETIARALQPFRITDDFHYMENRFLVFIAEK